jgi:hypothetical protein
MATTPGTANTGALALKPPRVNIFAKPGAGEGGRVSRGPQPRSLFDAAAACSPCDGFIDRRCALASHGVDSLGAKPRIGLVARLVTLTAIAGVIAAVAAQPRGSGTVDRPVAPSVQQPHPARTSGGSERRAPAASVTLHRPTRKNARSHRAARRRRTSHGGPRTPRLLPAATTPRVTPQRPAPSSSSARTRPLPARVAPSAPPEFL